MVIDRGDGVLFRRAASALGLAGTRAKAASTLDLAGTSRRTYHQLKRDVDEVRREDA